MDERLINVSDRNINTVAEAEQRGQMLLRQAELEADESLILAPVNCGQQLYDVIDVTDAPAGMNIAKKRVTGLTLSYDPSRGEYVQRLKLGRV
jgi:hypothetical protein